MRLAFIGGYGHHYLRGLLQEPGAEREYSVAIAGDGHDPEGARPLAAKIPGAAWYEDPPRLFDAFRPDVVSIGAVYGYNGEIAALALARGIAAVSDKPVAATWEQLQRLRELAEEGSRV